MTKNDDDDGDDDDDDSIDKYKICSGDKNSSFESIAFDLDIHILFLSL